MKRICTVRMLNEGCYDVARLNATFGPRALADPELWSLVTRTPNSFPEPSPSELEQAIRAGDYSEVDVREFLTLFREYSSEPISNLLECFPVVQIGFDDGSADTLTSLDLLARDIWEYQEYAAAFRDRTVLFSFAWASGQGNCSYLWDAIARRVLWETDEIAGLCATLPLPGLFVIHQCYSTYIAPPTNWLLVLREGETPRSRLINLDAEDLQAFQAVACPGHVAHNGTRAEECSSGARSLAAVPAAELQPLAGDEEDIHLAWDSSAGQLVIVSYTLHGASAEYRISADQLLKAVEA